MSVISTYSQISQISQFSQFSTRSKPLINNPIYPWSKIKLIENDNSLFPRYGHSSCSNSVETDVFFFGGISDEKFSNDVFSLDTDTYDVDIVKTTGTIPSPRSGHTHVRSGSNLIVFGGRLENIEDKPDYNLYNLNLGTKIWSKPSIKGVTPLGRFGHTAVLIGSIMYVFGGFIDGYYLNDLVAFDTKLLVDGKEACWEFIDPLNEPPPGRTGHVSCAYKGRIYIFGGTDGERCYNDTWYYDTKTKEWIELTCDTFIPVPRESHGSTLVDDVLYVFGGRTKEGKELADLAAFGISNKRWYMFQKMGPSPGPRYWLTVSSSDNVVMVFGGASSNSIKPDEDGVIHILDTSKIKYPIETFASDQSSPSQLQIVLSTFPQQKSLPKLRQPAINHEKEIMIENSNNRVELKARNPDIKVPSPRISSRPNSRVINNVNIVTTTTTTITSTTSTASSTASSSSTTATPRTKTGGNKRQSKNFDNNSRPSSIIDTKKSSNNNNNNEKIKKSRISPKKDGLSEKEVTQDSKKSEKKEENLENQPRNIKQKSKRNSQIIDIEKDDEKQESTKALKRFSVEKSILQRQNSVDTIRSVRSVRSLSSPSLKPKGARTLDKRSKVKLVNLESHNSISVKISQTELRSPISPIQTGFNSDKLKEKTTSDESEKEVTSTKLEKDIVSTKIDEESTSTKLEEEPTSTKLEEETTSTKLEEEIISVKPEEEITLVKPEEEITSAKLKEETTSIKPEEETTSIKPEEGITSAKPEKEITSAKLKEETTSIKPGEEITSAKPEEEKTSVKPEEEKTSVKPEEEKTSVKPEEEITLTKSEEEITSVKPGEEITSVKSEKEITSAKPEEEITSAKPGEEITSNKLKEEITASSPTIQITPPEKVYFNESRPPPVRPPRRRFYSEPLTVNTKQIEFGKLKSIEEKDLIVTNTPSSISSLSSQSYERKISITSSEGGRYYSTTNQFSSLERENLLERLSDADFKISELRKRERLYQAEIDLARKAGYIPTFSFNVENNDDLENIIDINEFVDIGEPGSEKFKVIEAIIKLSQQLQKAKETIANQERVASQKISDFERLYTASLEETAYFKAKFSALMNEYETERLAKAANDVEEIKQQLNEKTQKLEEASKNVEDEGNKVESIRDKVNFEQTDQGIIVSTRFKEIAARCDELEALHEIAHKELRASLSKYKEAVKNIQGTRNNSSKGFENKLKSAENTTVKSQEQLVYIKNRLSQVESDYQTAVEYTASAEQVLNKMKEELLQSKLDVGKLNGKVANVENHNGVLENRLKELQNTMNSHSNVRNSILKEYDQQLEQQQMNFEKEKDSLYQEIQSLQTKINHAQDEKNLMDQGYEALRRIYESLKNQNEMLKESNLMLESQSLESGRKGQELRNELIRKTIEFKRQEEENENDLEVSLEKDEVQEQSEQIERQRWEQEKQLLEQEISQFKESNKNLEKNNSELKKNVDDTESKIAILLDQMENAVDTYREIEDDIRDGSPALVGPIIRNEISSDSLKEELNSASSSSNNSNADLS